MARYNNLQIPTAIRPDAKLGKLRTSMIGKHFAYDHDLDGFNVVEILPLELTPTASDFIGGNDLKTTLVIPAGLPAVKLPVADVFPNIDLAIIEEQSLVVANLDVAFAGLSCTFVVPNSLISAYQSEYPTLTFTSWVLDVVFTIPYVGNSELTIEYVDQVVRVASGNVNDVDKVVVPPDFTSFEIDVFNYIFLKFPNAQSIERSLMGDYQAVDYIASSGTQYIDTGSLISTTDEVNISVESSDGGDVVLFGAMHSWEEGSICELARLNGLYRFNLGSAELSVSGKATFVYSGGQWSYEGTNYGYGMSNLDISAYIFARHIATGAGVDKYSSMKLYSCSISESGSIVRNFIPCYRKSDNVIGLYDLVNDVFYTNQGTGVFTKGSDVANPTETISRPALSTCTIYYDENTSHTLTSEIVQATLTRVPEFATAEKVIVPEWFTDAESGVATAISTAFPMCDDISLGTGAQTFAALPWNLIKIAVKLGMADDLFALGDTKTDVGTDSVTRTFRIIDFDHYGENELNVEQLSLDTNTVQWNTHDIVDDDGADNNYSLALIRTTHLPAQLLKYSSSLQAAIGNTTYQVAKNGLNNTVISLTDKLFLGSAKEYFGDSTNNCQSAEKAALTQFALYAANNNVWGFKQKTNGQNNKTYFTRSPFANGTGGCVDIEANGDEWGIYIDSSARVAPIFSIK